MSEKDTATISTKKITTSAAGYIWDSPCLKPLVFNPFYISALIIFVIWAIDLFHGKGFRKGGASILIQHMVISYIVVMSGITLNNMLIKHKYRLDKHEEREERDNHATEDSNRLISTYEE